MSFLSCASRGGVIDRHQHKAYRFERFVEGAYLSILDGGFFPFLGNPRIFEKICVLLGGKRGRALARCEITLAATHLSVLHVSVFPVFKQV